MGWVYGHVGLPNNGHRGGNQACIEEVYIYCVYTMLQVSYTGIKHLHKNFQVWKVFISLYQSAFEENIFPYFDVEVPFTFQSWIAKYRIVA